jgi:hypothetical protein
LLCFLQYPLLSNSPPQKWNFTPSSPSTPASKWYAHVNPTNLMGKFFAIHPICDWWWWLCMLLNLHIYYSPHQIEYKFSSRDQVKMHHITSGVFVSCIAALPFYINKYVS